ncbi:hypothetical protein HYALB_00005973 [Hymenoscyphus albidus]|uniref:Uncharacterized protein n=1 Tax=Hymenoscyphus albidus TaxID=595503 RepID=A0A9N9Q165_9HELO|nr:hypothetical protein HYALB_00005973 [Hymenoscyphus albidus]
MRYSTAVVLAILPFLTASPISQDATTPTPIFKARASDPSSIVEGREPQTAENGAFSQGSGPDPNAVAFAVPRSPVMEGNGRGGFAKGVEAREPQEGSREPASRPGPPINWDGHPQPEIRPGNARGANSRVKAREPQQAGSGFSSGGGNRPGPPVSLGAPRPPPGFGRRDPQGTFARPVDPNPISFDLPEAPTKEGSGWGATVIEERDPQWVTTGPAEDSLPAIELPEPPRDQGSGPGVTVIEGRDPQANDGNGADTSPRAQA